MRKAKDLIGKPVINQTTGEQIATVRDVIFDRDARHIAALLVDGGGWFREAQVIAWESVAGIGDVVMATGESPIRPANEVPAMEQERGHEVRLTGLPMMSESGDRIGTVGDLYVDDRGAVIGYEVRQGFMTGNKFLFSDNVQTVGRDAVIADTGQLTSVERARQEAHLHGHTERPAPAAETPSTAPASNLPAEGATIIERRPSRPRTYDAPAPRESSAAMPESTAMAMGAEPSIGSSLAETTRDDVALTHDSELTLSPESRREEDLKA
jgi:uncharacterized protein YrrD